FDQRDHPRWLLAGFVNSAAVDIDMTTIVHDDFVAHPLSERPQIGMGDQGSIGLPTEKEPLRPRHNEYAPIRKPVDTEGQRSRHASHDLAFAGEINCDNLLFTPIAEPQAIVVPPW